MTPYTEEDRAAARRYYEAEGLSAAARATGINKGTISSWARRHQWASSTTEAAEKLRQQTMLGRAQRQHIQDEDRQQLAARLLDEAHALLDELQRPTTYLEVINTAGKVVLVDDEQAAPPYVIAEIETAHPRYADQQKIATAAAIIIDKLQLLSGAPTERTDHTQHSADDTLTAELEQLEALARQLAHNDPGRNEHADTEQ